MSSANTSVPVPAFEGCVKAIAKDSREFPSWYNYDHYSHYSHVIPKFSAPPAAVLHQGQRVSSLGILDGLPNELISTIASHLDFQSLGCLMQVSLKGWNLVKSLRAYRDVMKYIPDTLTALVEADTIRYHSAAALHSTLQSSKCANCEELGQFLNLLTCRRSCSFCLNHHPNALLIPRAMAVSFFELTPMDVETLPSLLYEDLEDITPMRDLVYKHTTKHYYCMTPENVAEDLFRMVSVEAASSLADRVHGPEGYAQDYFDFIENWNSYGDDRDDMMEPMEYRKALDSKALGLAEVLTTDLSDPQWDINHYLEAPYAHTGHIPLPFLKPRVGIEPKFYCGGCDLTVDCDLWRDGLDETVSHDDPDSIRLGRMASAAQLRVRTEAEHLKHIEECPGAQILLSANEEDWSRFLVDGSM